MSTTRYTYDEAKILFQRFDDEIVLINLDSGSYYSFNPAAALVWELIDQGGSASSISEAIAVGRNGQAETLAQAVITFIGQLQEEGLITPGTAEALPAPALRLSTEATDEIPAFERYSDMEALLMLDPVHQVDDSGWPQAAPDNPSS